MISLELTNRDIKMKNFIIQCDSLLLYQIMCVAKQSDEDVKVDYTDNSTQKLKSFSRAT